MKEAIRVQRLVPAETVTDGSGKAIGERPVPAVGDRENAPSNQDAAPSPNAAALEAEPCDRWQDELTAAEWVDLYKAIARFKEIAVMRIAARRSRAAAGGND